MWSVAGESCPVWSEKAIVSGACSLRAAGRSARLDLLVVVAAVSACGLPSALESGASASTPTRPVVGAPTPNATGGFPAASQGGSLVVTTLALTLPDAVSRAVAFADGETVLLAGGLTRAGTITTILRLDPAGGTIAVIGHLADPVHDAGGAMVGGSAIVFGGGSGSPVKVVQVVEAGPGAVVGQLPGVRADLAAVDLAGQAFVVGGGTPARLDLAVLATTDGAHFRRIATLVAGARYPAVAAVGGSIFCVGGIDGTHDLAEIQVIDPATGSVRVIGHLPHGLSHAAALVIGRRLLVAGGRSGGVAQDAIWEIDPATGTATLAGRLPQPMADTAAVVAGGIGYLIGGDSTKLLATVIAVGFG